MHDLCVPKIRRSMCLRFFLEDKLSWYGARATCLAKGGRLPEVYSEEDNAAIFDLKVTIPSEKI